MSARDDYPKLSNWLSYGSQGAHDPEMRAMFDEIDQLRAWKESAMVQLGAWDEVWEAAGRPGGLGTSKAESTREEITRLLSVLTF